MARILMIIAKDGFRDEEFIEPNEVFKANDHDVVVASSQPGDCRGKLGAIVAAEKSIKDIVPYDYDAVVFVGGPGAPAFAEDEKALELAREFNKSGKLVGAICIAPVILAAAGILESKQITMFPDEKGIEFVKSQGADYRGTEIEVDGNIVTGNGPLAARRFAEKIVEKLRM